MALNSKTPQVLILGTGIAGLSAALKYANCEIPLEITVVSKADAAEGSTRYAQGGIASVWSKSDSFDEHIQDTLNAGAGLCHENIVNICVQEGPTRVQELIDHGVEFTRQKNADTDDSVKAEYDLHREGGHGKRRILHADDLTGWAIEKALLEKARAHPRIRILENHVAVDLITEGKVFKRWRKPGACLGAYVLNVATGKIITLAADVTLLATGGAGKVYLYTTNPDVSTGDGIAMAYRAGAQVANLEFMQFHPTSLYHPGALPFLITEAIRGEGAVLKNLRGEPFMDKHHEMKSLAPRDIVARAIDMEMKRTGDKHVLLDGTHLSDEHWRTHFPNIHEVCMKYGIDPSKQPIPVVPAAHYMCGGVLVHEHAETSIDHLYAIGEVACTGLHGANRLASNSLLEAVVFAHRAYEHSLQFLKSRQNGAASSAQTASVSSQLGGLHTLSGPLPEWDAGHAVELEEQIDITANWFEIRSLMWNYVGIVRSNRRLARAKRRIELLKTEIQEYYWNYLLTRDLIELRNLVTVADLIVQSTLLRKESRGLHYTVDYPNRDDTNQKIDTIL